MNYYLHDGESLTDWLVDIATGALTPPVRKWKRNKRKTVATSEEIDSRSTRSTKSTGDSYHLQRQQSQSTLKKVMFEIGGRILPGGVGKETVAAIVTKPFDTASERAKASCEMLSSHLLDHIKKLSGKKRVDLILF